MSNTTCQVTYFSYYQMLLQPVDLPVLVRGQADCAGLTLCESGVTKLTLRTLQEQTVFCFASSPAQDELLAVSRIAW
ncbi:hypothetical protein WJX82_003254 [Trebouxia sp. C0006]